jgi:hypothetical protein
VAEGYKGEVSAMVTGCATTKYHVATREDAETLAIQLAVRAALMKQGLAGQLAARAMPDLPKPTTVKVSLGASVNASVEAGVGGQKGPFALFGGAGASATAEQDLLHGTTTYTVGVNGSIGGKAGLGIIEASGALDAAASVSAVVGADGLPTKLSLHLAVGLSAKDALKLRSPLPELQQLDDQFTKGVLKSNGNANARFELDVDLSVDIPPAERANVARMLANPAVSTPEIVQYLREHGHASAELWSETSTTVGGGAAADDVLVFDAKLEGTHTGRSKLWSAP